MVNAISLKKLTSFATHDTEYRKRTNGHAQCSLANTIHFHVLLIRISVNQDSDIIQRCLFFNKLNNLFFLIKYGIEKIIYILPG